MGRLVLIEETGDTVSCEEIFEKTTEAYGNLMIIMSERMDDSAEEQAKCSGLYTLEGEFGFGFDYELDQYGKVRNYILEVPETK